jgi:hypothetical protein
MTSENEARSVRAGRQPTLRALLWVAAACGGLRRRVHGAGSERGDVPGWVLVTLMTAGLVTALWVLAGDALGRVFEEAITSVTGP